MAVFSETHIGCARSEYKDVKNKLSASLKNSDIISMKDITVAYNSDTKQYIVTDTNITEDHFVSVYYKDSSVVSTCGLRADVSEHTITFTFESEPSTDVVCTILITKKGGV